MSQWVAVAADPPAWSIFQWKPALNIWWLFLQEKEDYTQDLGQISVSAIEFCLPKIPLLFHPDSVDQINLGVK